MKYVSEIKYLQDDLLTKVVPASEIELRKDKNIIYLIKNKINGKVLVGQTVYTFNIRYCSDKSRIGESVSNSYLFNSILKYGYKNFEIYILEKNVKCKTILNILEKIYISKFKSNQKDYGYNIFDGGSSHNCPESTRKKIGDANRKDLEFYIKKSIAKHGDRYLYEKVVYTKPTIEVEIFCKSCNRYFFQTLRNHSSGHGCSICGLKRQKEKRSMSFDDFVKRSTKIHGTKFEYFRNSFVSVNK